MHRRSARHGVVHRATRMSLAGQMLALQLGVVLVVLLGVAAVSLAQLDAQNHAVEGRRAAAVAENVAANPVVRLALSGAGESAVSQAQGTVSSADDVSGSTTVSVARPDGVVVLSSDPAPGERSAYPPLQRTDAFAGRGWVGETAGGGQALAMAPVFTFTEQPGSAIRQVGVVAVSRAYPSVLDNLGAALPNLLTYLGIASLLGIIGSLLLARRVKRQTLGMEPVEITGLVEHREALLSGIKEGVVAVDLRRRLTMVNVEAARLLGVPLTAMGARLAEADPSGLLEDIFAPDGDGTERLDRVVPVGRRLVTVNRTPVHSHGRQIGWVATLRDRTDLLDMQRQLDLNKTTTDVLRSQAHEFSNRLHVLNGLLALGEYDDARGYIRQVSSDAGALSAAVTERIEDPAVAALLVAKASQAGERGVDFEVEPSSRLGRLAPGLSADVNTVVGNLVDNAFDAAGLSGRAPAVRVEIVTDLDVTPDGRDRDRHRDRVDATMVDPGAGVVVVTVRDSGPGVDDSAGERLFARGYSTKPVDAEHGRGIGLALVRLVCRGRGGDVEVHNDNGAVFVATLPMGAEGGS